MCASRGYRDRCGKPQRLPVAVGHIALFQIDSMFENKPLHDREPLSGKMRGKQEKGPVMFAGKSRTRLIVLTGILALAAAALEFWPMPGAPSVHLKPIPIRFTDEAGLIDTHDRGAFNSELNLLYDEMGVDIRILVVQIGRAHV